MDTHALRELQNKLGYDFRDESLLETALTHSSYTRERNRHVRCNERLEFLGDAFFDAIIGEELYRSFPDEEEGFLSRIRATIVCEKSLAMKAEAFDLGAYLLLGKGEEKTGGRTKVSILADAMEALMGAIYLDGGFEAVKTAVLRIFEDVLQDARKGIYIITDYKTALQEIVQRNGNVDIKYELVGETGPDHNKTFNVALYINDVLQAEGTGKSIKQAEQHAAEEALKRRQDVI
ncbi:MAG: ribonuclease III [Bacillota bacterium]|nr:ribonuclease III [Bacillota bacterium]